MTRLLAVSFTRFSACESGGSGNQFNKLCASRATEIIRDVSGSVMQGGNLVLVELSKIARGWIMPVGGFRFELSDKRTKLPLPIATLAPKRQPVSSVTANEAADNARANEPR